MRVKLDVMSDYASGVSYWADEKKSGKYSLSQEDYADYLATLKKYHDWQFKLADIRPDGYVAPPPPKPPTKEELEHRAFQLSDAYLDIIAPITGAA